MREISDLEQASPIGCTRLDERTIEDLDLAQVFTSIDRTRTTTGAQALWRWLAAPANDLDLLRAREEAISSLADPVLRAQIAKRLGKTSALDGRLVPRLLWEPAAKPLRDGLLPMLALALVAFLALALVWPPAFLGVVVMIGVNLVVDDWSKLRLAQQARSLEILDDLLGHAVAVARVVPAALASRIADDLAVRDVLHRRMRVLTLRDPFDVMDLVRAGLLVRLAITRSAMKLVEVERERLRRVVIWFGEVDALCSIAALRAERPALCVPELAIDHTTLIARDLVHPAIENAVGNDLDLARGLLVTGSNMSGKSTFLRTVAINAILAQSIHTTCGGWRAAPLRVRTVMRIADDPARGMSTYAVEVAAIGEMIEAIDERMLFVVDEPFNGTNPTIRVPIVVAVLEYLAGAGLVLAATHDLDVANRLDGRFARAYFAEHENGAFDRHLHTGIAPATNAVEILRRAGYPDAILTRLA